MKETDKDNEDVAYLIGTGTWRDWVRKIPKPVFAFGKYDIYSVFIKGHSFNLPIGDADKTAIGFYTGRLVAAENIHAAKTAAHNSVIQEWKSMGFLAICRTNPKLSIEEVTVLHERFRLRSGGGFAFYDSDDPDK